MTAAYPIHLELEFHDGVHSKVVGDWKHDLIIHPDHLEYSYQYVSLEHPADDPDMPAEEIFHEGRGIYLKHWVTAAEMAWQQKPKTHKIVVFVSGVPDDIFFRYKRRSKAEEHFRILTEWLIPDYAHKP